MRPRLDFGVQVSRQRYYFFLVRKDYLIGPLPEIIDRNLDWLKRCFQDHYTPISWPEPHLERSAPFVRDTFLLKASVGAQKESFLASFSGGQSRERRKGEALLNWIQAGFLIYCYLEEAERWRAQMATHALEGDENQQGLIWNRCLSSHGGQDHAAEEGPDGPSQEAWGCPYRSEPPGQSEGLIRNSVDEAMTILNKWKPSWKVCDLSQSLSRMPCVTKDDSHFFCITSGTVVKILRSCLRPQGKYWLKDKQREMRGTTSKGCIPRCRTGEVRDARISHSSPEAQRANRPRLPDMC